MRQGAVQREIANAGGDQRETRHCTSAAEPPGQAEFAPRGHGGGYDGGEQEHLDAVEPVDRVEDLARAVDVGRCSERCSQHHAEDALGG